MKKSAQKKGAGSSAEAAVIAADPAVAVAGDGGPVLEVVIAEGLGLTREVLREFRDAELTEGEHWSDTAEGVVYSPGGVDLLLRALQASQTARKKMARPDPVWLRVVRKVVNVRIVLAVRADQPARPGEFLTLKVPTVPGPDGRVMNYFAVQSVVPARHVEGAVWVFDGRAPRGVLDITRLTDRYKKEAAARRDAALTAAQAGGNGAGADTGGGANV